MFVGSVEFYTVMEVSVDYFVRSPDTELIHLGAQVMATGGTIDAFIQAVYNYPTLSDAYKYAAYDGLGAWERRQG